MYKWTKCPCIIKCMMAINKPFLDYGFSVLGGHSKRTLKFVFNTNYGLMQVKSIAECSRSAILSTFIKLPFVFKTCVLSILEWLLKTGFTVNIYIM